MSAASVEQQVEGTIPFREHQTWYRIVGEGEQPGKFPLLILHGGPGATHDYLEPLEALASTGRRVILYDQVGNGLSSQPHDPSLWTIDLFLDELATLRKALGLDHVHILGQSWGGMLALEHVLAGARGVEGLILSNTTSSMPLWTSEARQLLDAMPADIQAVLNGTAEGADEEAEFNATLAYYARHVCRAEPWPDYLWRTFQFAMSNPEVYRTMWGESEFNATGTLGDWDVTGRLGEFSLPTLILSGRHDESTPAINELLRDNIAGSEWVMFEDGSHMTHIEEPEAYRAAVSRFLESVEAE